MEVTLGPFITCFVTILFLTIYVFFTIHVRKEVLYGGTKVFSILISVILIRMLIPFNFPFTITIPSHKLLSVEIMAFEYVYGTKVTWVNLLFIIWITGAIIQIIRMFVKMYRVKTSLYPFRIRDLKKYPALHKILQQNDALHLSVCIIPANISPVIIGVFHPIFVLPEYDFTEKELVYACEHEIWHYKNHDHWLRLFIDLLLCVQWFNLFAYLLNNELALGIEIANDQRVLGKRDQLNRVEYAECILKIARNIKEKHGEYIGVPFVGIRNFEMKTRLDYISSDKFAAAKRTALSKVMQYIVIVSALAVSFCIVPERYHVDEEVREETVEVRTDNSYFVKDGTEYLLFVDGEYKFSFAYVPEDFKDLPVYKKEEME